MGLAKAEATEHTEKQLMEEGLCGLSGDTWISSCSHKQPRTVLKPARQYTPLCGQGKVNGRREELVTGN